MFLCDIGCKNHTLSLKALQYNTIQRYERIQIWVGKIIQKTYVNIKKKKNMYRDVVACLTGFTFIVEERKHQEIMLKVLRNNLGLLLLI